MDYVRMGKALLKSTALSLVVIAWVSLLTALLFNDHDVAYFIVLLVPAWVGIAWAVY